MINNVALKESYVQQLVNTAVPQTNEVTKPYSISTPPFVESQSNGQLYFTNTDPVWILFSNNALGYLTLPVQVGSNCRTGPPLKYFNEKTSNCYVTASQITSECTSATAQTSLSLAYFLNNYKILKVNKKKY